MPKKTAPHIPDGHHFNVNFQDLDDVQYFWYEMEAHLYNYVAFEAEYYDTLDADAKSYMESAMACYDQTKQDFIASFNLHYGGYENV